MPVPEWLARQRRFAEFDRLAEELTLKQLDEGAMAIFVQSQVERAKPAKPAPLVTWSRIDPEKVDER